MTLLNDLSLLLSPALFVLLLYLLGVKFKIKNRKYLVRAFLWGMVAVLLVVISHEAVRLRGWENLRKLRRVVFYVFVVVAFSAELGKFFFLRYIYYHHKTFHSPLAGIIYAVSIALGFSFVVIILFASGFLGYGRVRFFSLFLWLYPLANIIFGIVQGFFLGMGKVRNFSFIDGGTALGIATFLHALFFFSFLSSDRMLLVFTGFGLLVIASVLTIKAWELSSLTDILKSTGSNR